MTVLKSQRKTSTMEFLHNAYELRKYIVFKLLKDFGIKDKVRDTTYFINPKNLDEADKKHLSALLKQCECKAALEEYPSWFISTEREFINTLCRNMIVNIITANNIYITNLADADNRRQHQNEAIAATEMLLQELQFLLGVIPQIDANKLVPFIEMADREIALLKGWRKSDCKLRARLAGA